MDSEKMVMFKQDEDGGVKTRSEETEFSMYDPGAVSRYLRHVAWDRAKNDLGAILHSHHACGNHEKHEKFKKAFDEFRMYVEKEGLID